MTGIAAVINAAGPFAITASPMIEAAIRAGIPYLDIAAEPDVVAARIERHVGDAEGAGVALAPAIGFYGGLGDLLATAAMGDWPESDEISLAYSLSSWLPTAGTRATIEAAGERRGANGWRFRTVSWNSATMTRRSPNGPSPRRSASRSWSASSRRPTPSRSRAT